MAVVVPHHHRTDLLERCLASVAGRPVVVVADGPEAPKLLAGPVLVRTAGVGFARAANAGLAEAQARGFDLALLLNDDAAPEPGCIDALLAAWSDDVGAAAPALIGTDGEVVGAGLVVGRWGRVREVRRLDRPVHALSGACLLVRSTERFDEGYRHGFEDVALCRALTARGLRLARVPGARCLHDGGETVPRRSRDGQRHAVSGHLRLVGGGWRSAVVLALAAAQVVRERGPADRLAGALDGWRDWHRAQQVPRCTGEPWTRSHRPPKTGSSAT